MYRSPARLTSRPALLNSGLVDWMEDIIRLSLSGWLFPVIFAGAMAC
jgi:hypothetical protein